MCASTLNSSVCTAKKRDLKTLIPLADRQFLSSCVPCRVKTLFSLCMILILVVFFTRCVFLHIVTPKCKPATSSEVQRKTNCVTQTIQGPLTHSAVSLKSIFTGDLVCARHRLLGAEPALYFSANEEVAFSKRDKAGISNFRKRRMRLNATRE